MTKQRVCQKCGYRWKIRKDEPKECPRCKSRYWMKVDLYAES